MKFFFKKNEEMKDSEIQRMLLFIADPYVSKTLSELFKKIKSLEKRINSLENMVIKNSDEFLR